mmetsp:Transcript_10474/g.23786  ORF Transcript_10474/g.23786 Transcript_10474/m.23786 type:complete len:423 (+) Transcript_10474:43-1311(+)
MAVPQLLENAGEAASLNDANDARQHPARGCTGSWKSAGRQSSCSRRRQVRAEIEARHRPNADVFALQQKLLLPGAAGQLIEAATRLLQAADFDAVVTERALEGLCGYPSCSKAARGVKHGQKWTLDRATGEVRSAEELGSFCSRACMASCRALVASLEPDPAYCRPGSAVAAARAAVAEASGPQEPRPSPAKDDEHVPIKATADADTKTPVLPPVRTKTVVRFSREAKAHDGGVEKVQTVESGGEASEIAGLELDTGLMDMEAPDLAACWESLPASPFVRAWGVLTEWCTPLARELMAQTEPVVLPEVESASVTSRRQLLADLLAVRVPFDLASLGTGLHRLTTLVGMHQPLPPVTEVKLYDLLAIVMLDGLYRAEVAARGTSNDGSLKVAIQRHLHSAAEAYGVSPEELQVLRGIVADGLP